MTSTVFVNGRFLTQPLSGMQRFAGEILTALDNLITSKKGQLPKGTAIEVLVPKGERRNLGWQNIRVREVGRLRGHAWEQFNLAYSSKNGVLINLSSSGPVFHSRSILVLHDAAIFAHPKHFSANYGLWHRAVRPVLAKRAIRLVTISEFSRVELARWCKVPEADFTIIGDSAEHICDVHSDLNVLNKFQLTPKNYALTVGNQSPNKNINFAMEAFTNASHSNWKLAVAGGGSEGIFGSVQEQIQPSIVKLGRVTDEELRALYENSGLFLFPSKYEGFGVPPLEAMILGCPVLSSNSSAMPEILGDAASYFEVDNSSQCSNQISKLIGDESSRHELKVKGYKRAKLYSWESSAIALAKIISECLNASPRGS